jgi:predicted ribonuclease YlaK
VVPLCVVEELDAKTASRGRDLADRARGVLSHLESLIGPTAGAPAALRPDVTIEVLVDSDVGPDSSEREASADTAILDACDALAFLTGKSLTLVTADALTRSRQGTLLGIDAAHAARYSSRQRLTRLSRESLA